MPKLISIETTRYSEFLRHLLTEYAEGVTIEIGGRQFASEDIPKLLTEWCTNAEICRTRDFRLLRSSAELFGFHYHPRDLWAAESELSFVQRMAAGHIIQFELSNYEPKR